MESTSITVKSVEPINQGKSFLVKTVDDKEFWLPAKLHAMMQGPGTYAVEYTPSEWNGKTNKWISRVVATSGALPGYSHGGTTAPPIYSAVTEAPDRVDPQLFKSAHMAAMGFINSAWRGAADCPDSSTLFNIYYKVAFNFMAGMVKAEEEFLAEAGRHKASKE